MRSVFALSLLLALMPASQPLWAQSPTIPNAPSPSLALFAIPAVNPKTFEVQTASANGTMMFGQGTLNITTNGSVSGRLNMTTRTANATQGLLRSNIPFTGRISNPRTLRQKLEFESGWAYRIVDYLADFTAETSRTPINPPVYRVRGVLVYRYRVSYEISGNRIIGTYNESYLDPKVSVFGPNGEIGFVSGSD